MGIHTCVDEADDLDIGQSWLNTRDFASHAVQPNDDLALVFDPFGGHHRGEGLCDLKHAEFVVQRVGVVVDDAVEMGLFVSLVCLHFRKRRE